MVQGLEPRISERMSRIVRKPPLRRFLAALRIRPNSLTEKHIANIYPKLKFAAGKKALVLSISEILKGVQPQDVGKRGKDPETLSLTEAKLLVTSRILGNNHQAKEVLRMIEGGRWNVNETMRLAPPRRVSIFNCLLLREPPTGWHSGALDTLRKATMDFSGCDVTLPGLLEPLKIDYPGVGNGSLPTQKRILGDRLSEWNYIFFAGGHQLLPEHGREPMMTRLVELAMAKMATDAPEARIEGAIWLAIFDIQSGMLEDVLAGLGYSMKEIIESKNRMGEIFLYDGINNSEQKHLMKVFSDVILVPGNEDATIEDKADDSQFLI
ncbi:MAG: hypothetical protein KKH83_05350 [Candidatus Margulisbacteria bacterium]|nr:hypothetical protein [Candidatus Margulisiibacteriota bacterium]